MPFVNIRTAKGLLSPSQKAELSARITDLMVEVEGRGNAPFRNLVWVLIEEHDADSWCLGGTQVTADMLDELALGGSTTAAGHPTGSPTACSTRSNAPSSA